MNGIEGTGSGGNIAIIQEFRGKMLLQSSLTRGKLVLSMYKKHSLCCTIRVLHELLYLNIVFLIKQDAKIFGVCVPLSIKPIRVEKCFINCCNSYLWNWRIA